MFRSLSFIFQRYQVGPEGEGSPLTPAFPSLPRLFLCQGRAASVCTSKCRFFFTICVAL